MLHDLCIWQLDKSITAPLAGGLADSSVLYYFSVLCLGWNAFTSLVPEVYYLSKNWMDLPALSSITEPRCPWLDSHSRFGWLCPNAVPPVTSSSYQPGSKKQDTEARIDGRSLHFESLQTPLPSSLTVCRLLKCLHCGFLHGNWGMIHVEYTLPKRLETRNALRFSDLCDSDMNTRSYLGGGIQV